MSASFLPAIIRSPSCNPYSLSRHFLRMAISRRRTLCSFEPVKYCNAAPNDSEDTTRRSTWSSRRPASSTVTEPLVEPGGQHPLHAVEGHEPLDDRFSLIGCTQDVHVADRLLPAAQRSCDLHLLHTGHRRDLRRERLGDRHGLAQRGPAAARLQEGDPLADFLGARLAQSRQLLEFARPR